MFNTPTRKGFSVLPRVMWNKYADKMAAPNNAYYVLTQAQAGLPNSVLTTALTTGLIPDTTNAYDLGTNPLRWRNLYLSGNAVAAGSITAGTNFVVGTTTIAPASITDTTGAIDFGDEDLITTGDISGVNANWDAAFAHVSADGSSHGFINQDVTTTGTPQFAKLGLGAAATTNILYVLGDPAVSDTIKLLHNYTGGATASIGFWLDLDNSSAASNNFSNFTGVYVPLDQRHSLNNAVAKTQSGIGLGFGVINYAEFQGTTANSVIDSYGVQGWAVNRAEDKIGVGTTNVYNTYGTFSLARDEAGYSDDEYVTANVYGAYGSGEINWDVIMTNIGILTGTAYGGYFKGISNCSLVMSTGDINTTIYGGYFEAVGQTDITSCTAYGGYFTATGADVNYAGYFGDGTNATRIKEDGEIELLGTARVERHLLVDPTRFKMPAANFPGESFEGLFYTLDFDKATDESAYCVEHIPFRWDSGTDIEVEVDWFHDGVDAGKVMWAIEFKGIKEDEAVIGGGANISQLSAGNHTAGEMQRTTFTTKIAHGLLEVHDIMAVRFYRDANHASDTLDEDARVVNICFHFIQNKIGQAT